MTIDEFLINIESIYGVYENENLKKAVVAYIKHDIRLDRLNILKRYIYYYHHKNYGVPGISNIESAIDKAIKNNKGDDVRLVRKFSTVLKERPLTTAEKEENKRILAEYENGLLGMLENLQAKKKEWKKDKNKEKVVF